MIDIKFLRENPDAVKENIKKKFQDSKLPMVDEVIELDKQSRAAKAEADDLRNQLDPVGAALPEIRHEGVAQHGLSLVGRLGGKLREVLGRGIAFLAHGLRHLAADGQDGDLFHPLPLQGVQAQARFPDRIGVETAA